MKTEKEIREKLEWLLKAVDDEDNQQELMQVKLWTQIDFCNWILGGK